MSACARPATCVHIPTLRSREPQPAEYAGTTCYEAGYLVARNAGWRNVRPVIDLAACTGCLQCYLYCPDGTIFKVVPVSGASPRAAVQVAVDYDFCKGCGVCAKECRFGAIVMRSEQEMLALETDACEAHAAAPAASSSCDPAPAALMANAVAPSAPAPAKEATR